MSGSEAGSKSGSKPGPESDLKREPESDPKLETESGSKPDLEDTLIVDIHTHMYPPTYIKILSSRSTIPLVRTFPQPRLILLATEVESMKAAMDDASSNPPGRPLTPQFTDIRMKVHFMDTHRINVSVISLANPWLDFLTPEESGAIARCVNEEFSQMCGLYPGRLYFFGALPLAAPLSTILASINHLKDIKYCRGVILGTSGLGNGLDDDNMLPIFEALAAAKLPVFLHPHYGLPNEVWGPRASEYGHVLPLALGFPMETTIAVARMYLSGAFDKVPALQMILAHAGGTLPFLEGRVESCIMHDRQLLDAGRAGPNRRRIRTVLREQIYLDAVTYSEVSLGAACRTIGEDRVMFGTDHPFFPPLETSELGMWPSASVGGTIASTLGRSTYQGIMGRNAVRILGLSEDA